MAEKLITHGFGVPNDPLPHQFLIRIPAGRTDPVEVWEDFGAAGVGTTAQRLCRATIPRDTWRQVAEGVKAHLNRRLKEKDLKASRFKAGDTRVERILGRELCVLTWAIEDATPDEAAIAFTGRPSATWRSSDSSASLRAPSTRTGDTSAWTISGSSIEPPVATSRMARASRFPSATRSLSR